MITFYKLGILFEGVVRVEALLFGVHIRALQLWKLEGCGTAKPPKNLLITYSRQQKV